MLILQCISRYLFIILHGLIFKFICLLSLLKVEIDNRRFNCVYSDTVSTYQVSSVQLVTNKKLEAFNKA